MSILILDILGYVILICIWLIIFPQNKEQAVDLANHLVPFLFLYLGGQMMRLLFGSPDERLSFFTTDPPIPETLDPEGEEET